MIDTSATRELLFDLTESLVRLRFHLASLVAGLETDRDEEEENPDIGELRADMECALFDHFDPMLRSLLTAAGNPRARILEAALDVAGLSSRLRVLSANLPRSPQEDAMIEGEVPPDVSTEMRITLNAVVVDQLDMALSNLLHAAEYNPPEGSS
ncbi:MAG TPA: hypothetical protein VH394_18680 [Thermoanaerobaculia bacterium]|nr:hypothetical protein [Thermoanaerobaculia bacterium]